MSFESFRHFFSDESSTPPILDTEKTEAQFVEADVKKGLSFDELLAKHPGAEDIIIQKMAIIPPDRDASPKTRGEIETDIRKGIQRCRGLNKETFAILVERGILRFDNSMGILIEEAFERLPVEELWTLMRQKKDRSLLIWALANRRAFRGFTVEKFAQEIVENNLGTSYEKNYQKLGDPKINLTALMGYTTPKEARVLAQALCGTDKKNVYAHLEYSAKAGDLPLSEVIDIVDTYDLPFTFHPQALDRLPPFGDLDTEEQKKRRSMGFKMLNAGDLDEVAKIREICGLSAEETATYCTEKARDMAYIDKVIAADAEHRGYGMRYLVSVAGPRTLSAEIAKKVLGYKGEEGTSTFKRESYRNAVLRHIDAFALEKEDILDLFKERIEMDDLEGALTLYHVKEGLSVVVDKMIDIVGEDGISLELYRLIEEILNTTSKEPLSDEARKIGVTRRGPAGLEQLRLGLQGVFTGVVEEQEYAVAAITTSSVAKRHTIAKLRFNTSQWGSHGERLFDQTVQTHREKQAAGTIEPLREVYTPSETVPIEKKGDVNKEFTYGEGFLSRYHKLRAGIEGARALIDGTEGIAPLFERIQKKRDTLLGELRAKRENPASLGQEGRKIDIGKALAFLDKQIAQIERIDTTNITPESMQEMLATLAQYHQIFSEELLQTLYWWSFQFNPQYLHADLDRLNTDRPSIDDIAWMIEFTDHITNKETLSKYATTGPAKKALRDILNVNALTEEMGRIESEREGAGALPLRYVPSRGLMMEFSGHTGDACWASKYPSIAEQFPNMTAVTMVAHPDDPKLAKVAGSFMLIETISQTGDPLLVIRGLNPLENVINHLDVDAFYKQTVAYVKSVAKKMNREVAIVIDGHSGGSGTNRPILFDRLSEIKKDLTQIPLASKEDTAFNGYDITKVTYKV